METESGRLSVSAADPTYAARMANFTGIQVMISLAGRTSKPPRPPPRTEGSGEHGLMDTASHFGIAGAWGAAIADAECNALPRAASDCCNVARCSSRFGLHD